MLNCRCFLFPFICNMKTLQKIYIYREPESNSLPEDGWFQRCILCYSITNHQQYFETYHEKKMIYEVTAYICKPCQNVKKKSATIAARYKRVCDRYVRKQIFISQ